MGKIDIDYQVLHDAFFKYQTKPKMTSVGEFYYEGKEYETDLKGEKPGVLSEETRAALGMTEDGPPPWLINMQRYGPPPSYPNLKIPGLSAPIPPGAQFGYHPGGWGKPPVDEYGNPVYGDVFGVRASADDGSTPYDVVLERRKRWGALEELSESESEDEEEEEEEESDAGEEELGEEEMAAGIATGATGVETPEAPMDLRKRSAAPDAPRSCTACWTRERRTWPTATSWEARTCTWCPVLAVTWRALCRGRRAPSEPPRARRRLRSTRRTWRRAWTTRRCGEVRGGGGGEEGGFGAGGFLGHGCRERQEDQTKGGGEEEGVGREEVQVLGVGEARERERSEGAPPGGGL